MKTTILKVSAFTAITLFMVSFAAKANPGQDLASVLFGNKKAVSKTHARKVQAAYKPSVRSLDNFYVNFGNVDPVMWSADGALDVAVFVLDGKEVKAFFDVEGALIGTVEGKQYGDLPENARTYIAKKYADYDVAEVIYFDDNEYSSSTMNVYDQNTQDEDNYFISLKKDGKEIVLRVDMQGGVHFYKELNF